MRNKLLLILICITPFLSQAQVKAIIGNDIVSLKTFTTVLSDAVKAEKIDDYFNPLGYKFTDKKKISVQGTPGILFSYIGDQSSFKVSVVKHLKLAVLYETVNADQFQSILTEIQKTAGYKMVDHSESAVIGLLVTVTYANIDYVVVFRTMRTVSGMLYVIATQSKVNNLVVNGDNNY
jgi:hypothetical protein